MCDGEIGRRPTRVLPGLVVGEGPELGVHPPGDVSKHLGSEVETGFGTRVREDGGHPSEGGAGDLVHRLPSLVPVSTARYVRPLRQELFVEPSENLRQLFLGPPHHDAHAEAFGGLLDAIESPFVLAIDVVENENHVVAGGVVGGERSPTTQLDLTGARAHGEHRGGTVVGPPARKQFAQPRFEVLGIDRLGHQRVDAGPIRSLGVGWIRVSGRGEDG